MDPVDKFLLRLPRKKEVRSQSFTLMNFLQKANSCSTKVLETNGLISEKNSTEDEGIE